MSSISSVSNHPNPRLDHVRPVSKRFTWTEAEIDTSLNDINQKNQIRRFFYNKIFANNVLGNTRPALEYGHYVQSVIKAPCDHPDCIKNRHEMMRPEIWVLAEFSNVASEKIDVNDRELADAIPGGLKLPPKDLRQMALEQQALHIDEIRASSITPPAEGYRITPSTESEPESDADGFIFPMDLSV